MNRSDWTRLWECFHAALELPVAERAAWLDVHAGDAEMRAELDALLQAHARGDSALDSPLQAESIAVGRRIGAWRLVRELGRGGMGAVWLAERDDAGFTQRAALKFVATSFSQPALLARFRRERQILAALQHPDIARMLDGGVTHEGAPWFAMEFVDGVPLDRWCRERAPGLRQRLQLMQRLCAAVHYAPQHLVVHRDLKPGNVLIDCDDRPVLVDVGIAKLLQDTDDPERTGTAMPALFTPRYASPEQLLGKPAGTASDVYSLGLVLYELLCGQPPFAAPADSWSEWIAEVTERLPVPPSTRGGALVLDRELDAIVLMALRKEPQRRYSSAAALAEDLQRYLDHHPVRARPDSARYRFAKFARRHRMGLALGAVAVLVLAALALQLVLESARTTAALEMSQRERRRAEDTVSLLTDVFREADPTRGDGREVSAREVLERGLRLLEGRPLDAASRAAVLTTLGEIFVNAGAYARAEALFTEALALSETIERGESLRGDALHGLGGALQAASRHADALQRLNQALSLRGRAYGEDSLEVAATTERLGSAAQSLADYEVARAAYARTLGIRLSRLAADDVRIAEVQLRMGSLAWATGRYKEAEPHYRKALEVRRQHPEQAAELARALDAMGALAHMRGQHDEARSHYREALDLRRRVLGTQHRLTADTLGNLGALAYDQGDPGAAIPLLTEALAAQRVAVGGDSPVVAKTLNNLALAQAALGQREAARRVLEEALAINRKAFGEQHVRVAGNLNNLGLVQLDDGDAAAAEPNFVAAIAAMEALAGADDPQLGFALNNRARALLELGRRDEAEVVFARTLALRRKHLDASHPSLAETLSWYGVLRCEGDDAERGVAMLNEALVLRRRVFGAAHLSTAQMLALLAACQIHAGRSDQVTPELQAAARRVAADPGSGAPLRGRAGGVMESGAVP